MLSFIGYEYVFKMVLSGGFSCISAEVWRHLDHMYLDVYLYNKGVQPQGFTMGGQ